MAKFKAYACKVDLEWHVPSDIGGIRIYFTREDAERELLCCSGDSDFCSVEEFEIDIPSRGV